MDENLIKILACPKCKSDVESRDDKIICKNPKCGLKYPVKGGIPVMLIEEAEKQR